MTANALDWKEEEKKLLFCFLLAFCHLHFKKVSEIVHLFLFRQISNGCRSLKPSTARIYCLWSTRRSRFNEILRGSIGMKNSSYCFKGTYSKFLNYTETACWANGPTFPALSSSNPKDKPIKLLSNVGNIGTIIWIWPLREASGTSNRTSPSSNQPWIMGTSGRVWLICWMENGLNTW